jgi:transposase InsO family protein
MNEEIREQIALARYKLISPVLAEPGREQNAYLRELAEREHLMPHYGARSYAMSTFKGWLRKYASGGFDALKPRGRSDRGRPRRLSEHNLAVIEARCKAYPQLTIQMLYEQLLAEEQLGDPPIGYNNLVRIVRQRDLLTGRRRSDVRKRFETAECNELWVCDFMHGPMVRTDRNRAKAILCAVIDDHSRMIVGHAFSASETVASLTIVLKEAFEAYGLPKRLYVDNGPSFSSDLLAKACAQAGISLIHSKPYDSPSRGKVERFFRTVRERFLVTVESEPTLDELNTSFSLWLREDYHHKEHRGIDGRPVDRHHASCGRVQIRRITKSELDEIFLVRHERIVNNDATISFKGNIYETPAAYIRQRIELRHPVDEPTELYLYDNGARVGRLKLLDARENARTFRPTQAEAPIRLARKPVQSEDQP